MSAKKKKASKKGGIIISSVLAVLLIGAIALALLIFLPHNKKVLSILPMTGNADINDGRFNYRCADGLTALYIDSDVDLSTVLEDKDPQSDDLGEQTLKLKFAGFRELKTDNMGVWMSYPVVVYEYAGE